MGQRRRRISPPAASATPTSANVVGSGTEAEASTTGIQSVHGAIIMKATLLLLLMWAGCAQAADCPRVVFSANPNYPPFHWVEDGKLMGASIELTERVFKELGVSAEARYVGSWNRVLHAAELGQIDMVAALKGTPEREVYLDFTSARFSANPMAVFVRANHRIPFGGWTDLIGRTGLVARGDRFGDGFDEFLHEKLQVMSSNDMADGFANLQRGRAEYFVTSYLVGSAYLAATGLDTTIFPLSPMVNSGSIHHGFVRLSPCLKYKGAVSAKLQSYDADGTTAKLIRKYDELWRKRPGTRPE